MDKIIFNDKSYDLAINGINVSNDTLTIGLVTDDLLGVETDLAGATDIEHTLEDGTVVAKYIGYTKMNMLTKQFDQVVDYLAETHIEQRTYYDPDKGEEVTEEIPVTDYIPQFGTVVRVTLIQPTLEDEVRENSEQITELQEAVAEIAGA